VRTLNVRLAIILLAVIIVGGASGFLIHYIQQYRNAGFFLEQADLAKQDADKAKKDKNSEEEEKARKRQIENMQWYLALRPYDLDKMEELGMLKADHILDAQTFYQAYSLLDKVVREDETRNKARHKLFGLLMDPRIGRFSEALEHIRYLLQESPDNPDLLLLAGQCETATREYENARKSLEKAISYSPKQIDTYPLLANVLNKGLDKPKEAYNCLENMVKNNPNSAKAYIYLGTYWETIDSKDEVKRITDKDLDPRDEAMKAAEKALELDPNDADGLLLAARCSIASNKLEDARKYTEHNIDIHKDSPMVYTTMAEIMARSGEKDKAIEVLNRGLKETKNSFLVLWYKANLLIDSKNLDEARETLEKLRTTELEKARLNYLEARISFAKKDWAEAADRFEKVRPSLVFWPNLLKQADLYLGYCYGQLSNVDKEISAYQRVLAIDPFHAPARKGLIDAYVASGQLDNAVNEYSTLMQTHNMPDTALISLAHLLIRRNLQRGAKVQNWDQVEKVINQAEKALPDAEQIPLLRVEVLHAQNRDEEAEKILQKSHQKNPKQIEYWKAMVSLAAWQKKWDQAEKILADFEQQMGDSPDLRLARCEYLVLRYDAKAGEHLAKLGENIDGFSDADRIRLWDGLLNASRRIADGKLAKQYINLLSQKDAGNLEVQFLRLEQAANSQDLAGLEDALNDIKKVEKEGALWLFGRARLLALKAVKENKPALLDEALQNLNQARDMRPNWSRIPLFMGSIYEQQNKLDSALKFYKEAIDMGEHNIAAVRRTVQILFQKQRYDDAEKIFRQLDNMQVPITPELTRLWVELLFQQREFDLALAKARQAVSEKSDDYKEHLWLGQILGIAARRAKAQNRDKDFSSLAAEAEKSLRRAVELKGDLAETWMALVGFLSSVDKTSAAEDVINQAQGKIPPDKAPIALAQCYEAVEKNDLAMEQYRLALAAKPDDPGVVRSVADFYQRIGKTTDAEALLRMIIDGKVKGDEANLLWARRELAKITAAKGGLLNMEAARKLIQQNLDASANSADDMRIKAKFSALDPRASRRDEAIDILKKMMEGQLATPEDRFNLALLYMATEKKLQSRSSSGSGKDAGGEKGGTAWSNASKILRDLILSQDSDPRYLAIYINALLEHGDVSGAELYLNKLTKDFPRAAATIVLQAQIMARRNQFDEALELMKSFVDMKNAVPPDRSKRIRMMAEAMEELTERMKKNPDQKIIAEHYSRTTEAFYRQYVDEHPSQSMDLVMFFVRQDQIEDAVNILEQTWQNSDPITVAQISMNIVQREKKSKEIMQRVEKVLTDARGRYANHPGILITLGDVRAIQNRYTESENLYREILDKNPGHSVAMNNLAVLLTLQNKKLDEALTLINNAIEIAGPLASMLDTRACVYIAQGNAEKAIKDMEVAIADAATPVRLFHQAQALNLGNQPYAASSTMQQALKAGLTTDMLETPEIPAYEKLKKLAGELGTAADVKK
jgi:tetratricopeptide (TPR) repeat protein